MFQDILSRDEAAEYLGYSKRTLEKWAERDMGPPYFRRGRRVFYSIVDLDTWVIQNRLTTPTNGVNY